MASSLPPRFDGMSASDAGVDKRLTTVTKIFQEQFKKDATFIACAPGRVNLIGEHIDYCGYAVLPMAIEQNIMIAAAQNGKDIIRLANTDKKYSEQSFPVNQLAIDYTTPLWYNYFLCGFRGVLEHCGLASSQGLDLLVDGSVPPSAGLSSSSALVCCSALAIAEANGKPISKLELAEICQKCEHYVGTEGGGMDQAISFLAEPGTAKLIEFNPVRATDVHLPKGAVFVISNSCVEMNKAATSHFNTRVAECRLATQVMAKKKERPWRENRRLGDLQTDLGLTLSDAVDLVKTSLHPAAYNKKEICDILDISKEELNDISLSEKTFHIEEFKLHDRALHVFSEAERVMRFKDVCDRGGGDDAMQELGSLMNESHLSCRDLYQCSCDTLDELVQICLDGGAIGSRLTGAGWGGCAVSLVAEDRVESFLSHVTKNFYEVTPERQAKLRVSLFKTNPGGGAAVYTLK